MATDKVQRLRDAHRGSMRPLALQQAQQAVDDGRLMLRHFTSTRVPLADVRGWFRAARGVMRLHRRRVELAVEAAGGWIDGSTVFLPLAATKMGTDRATQAAPKEAAGQPISDKVRRWIRASPEGSTIGDGCTAFGVSPLEFIAARDGKRDQ